MHGINEDGQMQFSINTEIKLKQKDLCHSFVLGFIEVLQAVADDIL